MRPISPHISEELREAQDAYRKLSKYVDECRRKGWGHVQKTQDALDRAMSKMREEAQASVMQGYYQYVDGLDHMESHLMSKTLARGKRSRMQRKGGLLDSSLNALITYEKHFGTQFSRVAEAVEYDHQ